MFSLELPDTAPKDPIDILMLPLVFVVLSVFFWASQFVYTRDKGRRPKLWWLYWVPTLVGIWIGIRNVYFMTDTLYFQDLGGMRNRILHVVPLVLPIAMLGIFKLWSKFSRTESAS